MSATSLDSKCIAFIVSAGRTGTQFFGRFMPKMVSGSFSSHEPDAFQPRFLEMLGKIRTFGAWHMLGRRLLGRSGIRNLAQRYRAGKLSREQVLAEVHRHRDRYYLGIEEDLIVESHCRWATMLDVIPDAFPHYKVVAILRDPRTWATSALSRGTQFGPKDLVTRLGYRRLEPSMTGDAEWTERWPTMSPFARNCWTWKATTEFMLGFVESDPQSRLWRYEDLFLGEGRVAQMHDLLAFVTDWGERKWEWSFDESLYGTKQNASKPSFAGWRHWTPGQARDLDELCGPLMRKHGYGDEPEWQALLGGSTGD